jgi:SPP1 gp7 family putative phage head morphogenesis protein
VAGLLETAARQRAALLRQDRAAGADLLRAYAQVWARLDGELALLTDAIAGARSAGVALSEDRWRRIIAPRKPLVQALSGETFSEAATRVEVRYRLLRAQLLTEMDRYARTAEGVITASQRRAIASGLADAEGLLAAATGTGGVGLAFNRLPVGALQELVGVLADGSPLSALLGELGPQADAALREALVTGLGLGKGPRAIALDMRRSTNVTAVRSLRIARNETLRAFRSASQETFKANRDILSGWVWWAALSKRTCPVCYAMHGTFHKLDEPFASHVACRCTQLPSTKAAPLRVTRGAEAFGKLPEEDQRAILGPGKFVAYQRGDLVLNDLVAKTRDRDWGPGRRERSLREVGLTRVAASRQPVRPVGPAGTPVSAALQLPKGKYGQSLQVTLDAIDKVHGDGPLPTIPVEATSSRGRQGAFWVNTRTGEALKITVSRNADAPAFTLAHEAGHFLDAYGVNVGGAIRGASASGSNEAAIKEWRQAVVNSRATKELKGTYIKGSVPVTLPDGVKTTYPVDARYIQYVLGTDEQWARSYAQYVAVRSGDPTLLAQLNTVRDRHNGQVYYATQWADDDFEPIAAAFDTLFAQLGWRR